MGTSGLTTARAADLGGTWVRMDLQTPGDDSPRPFGPGLGNGLDWNANREYAGDFSWLALPGCRSARQLPFATEVVENVIAWYPPIL